TSASRSRASCSSRSTMSASVRDRFAGSAMLLEESSQVSGLKGRAGSLSDTPYSRRRPGTHRTRHGWRRANRRSRRAAPIRSQGGTSFRMRGWGNSQVSRGGASLREATHHPGKLGSCPSHASGNLCRLVSEWERPAANDGWPGATRGGYDGFRGDASSKGYPTDSRLALLVPTPATILLKAWRTPRNDL